MGGGQITNATILVVTTRRKHILLSSPCREGLSRSTRERRGRGDDGKRARQSDPDGHRHAQIDGLEAPRHPRGGGAEFVPFRAARFDTDGFRRTRTKRAQRLSPKRLTSRPAQLIVSPRWTTGTRQTSPSPAPPHGNCQCRHLASANLPPRAARARLNKRESFAGTAHELSG